MSIIFIDLPQVVEPIAKILSKIGLEIYYINLVGKKDLHQKRVNSLKNIGIEPIPIANIEKIQSIYEYDNGPKSHDYDHSSDLINSKILQSQIVLYEGISSVAEKLKFSIKTGREFANLAKLNIWARSKPNENHKVITFSTAELCNIGYEKNINISWIVYFLSFPFLIIKNIFRLQIHLGLFNFFSRKKKNTEKF